MAKYAEKLYENRVITVRGEERQVMSCDYEPPDPSVGIMGGVLMITTDDGKEYNVWDDGTIVDPNNNDETVGEGPELTPSGD